MLISTAQGHPTRVLFKTTYIKHGIVERILVLKR